MFLVRFFRFLSGYVEFQVSGGFLERFINLCNVNGLNMWNIRRQGDIISATTDIKSYKKMHACARKTGSVTRLTRKHGAPFLIHKYRHRVGILAGMLVFAILMAVLTSFIWTVEVEGNETLDSHTVLSYYEGQGLKKGVWRHKLDLSYLENKGMSDLPELSWVSINLYGSKAVIELRERVDAPERVPKEKPCNIKARTDGLILKINVFDGYSVVHEGDSVVRDDLLVSAVSVSEATGMAFYKHAQASVLAETEHVLTEEIAAKEEVRNYTGEIKKRSYLLFFGIKIPLGLTKPPEGLYELDEADHDWVVGGTTLPISYHKREYKAYTAEMRELSEEEMKAKAVAMMEQRLKTDTFIQSVVQSDYQAASTGAGLLVTGTFRCREEIGRQEEVQIEQSDLPDAEAN